MCIPSASYQDNIIQSRSAQGVHHAGEGGSLVGVDEGTAVGRGPGGRLEHPGLVLHTPEPGGASLSLTAVPSVGGVASPGWGMLPPPLTGGQILHSKAGDLEPQARFLALGCPVTIPAAPTEPGVAHEDTFASLGTLLPEVHSFDAPHHPIGAGVGDDVVRSPSRHFSSPHIEGIPSKGVGQGMQVSLDWLSTTFRPTSDDAVDVAQVQLAVSLAIGCELGDWVELEHGTHGYRFAMLGPGGARLDWGAPGRDDFHVALPGKACQAAGGVRMQQYARYVVAHRGRVTRLDLAMDDYGRTVTPADFLGAIKGPDVVTHAKRGRAIEGFTVREGSQPTGATCYLGSPQSRVQLRVYDKGLESQGKQDCIRHELQLRDEPAQVVLQELAGGRNWGETWASHLVRFVDFRHPAAEDTNKTRWERVPWFQALVGLAEKALAYLPKPEKTMAQVLSWLKHSIAPSLALAVEFWQGDLGELVTLLDDGRRRWKPRHDRILAGI